MPCRRTGFTPLGNGKIYRGMRDAHVAKSELARRENWHFPRSISCST